MRYLLSQKLMSFGDDYKIEDEEGRLCYKIDGKVFSIGEKLYFEDPNGNRLFKLRKKIMALTDTFIIERAGDNYAEVRRKMLTPIREKFIIETPYGELLAKGDFIDHEFSIYNEEEEKVAEVSKKILSIRDKYVIDIYDFNDHSLILAAAVIIDMIEHNDNEND